MKYLNLSNKKYYFFIFLMLFFWKCNGSIDTANDGEEKVDIILEVTSINQIGDILPIKIKTYLSNPTGQGIVKLRGNYNSNCFALDEYYTAHSSNEYTSHNINTGSFSSGCNQNDQTYSIELVVTDGTTQRSSGKRYFNVGNPGSVPLGELFVSKAREMLSGCPAFFEPPNEFNGYIGNYKNNSGSVSWSSTILNYRTSPNTPSENETKIHYINKLNAAGFSFQVNWSSYSCGYSTGDYSKGFPFPLIDDPGFTYFGLESFLTCSSGFVCYAFLWEAARQVSGYSLPYDFTGKNQQDPFEKLHLYTTIEHSNRKVGDIVIYRTNPSYSEDHVAIISQVNSNDMKQDKVISAYGFSEIFHWGARETKLWDFHSTRANPPGIFTSEFDEGKWPDARDHWDLSNVTIVRLN